jgi:hypothetical protein
VEADRDVRPGQAFTENMYLAVGVVDSQGALTDEASKQFGQQKHAEVLRGRRRLLQNKRSYFFAIFVSVAICLKKSLIG